MPAVRRACCPSRSCAPLHLLADVRSGSGSLEAAPPRPGAMCGPIADHGFVPPFVPQFVPPFVPPLLAAEAKAACRSCLPQRPCAPRSHGSCCRHSCCAKRLSPWLPAHRVRAWLAAARAAVAVAACMMWSGKKRNRSENRTAQSSTPALAAPTSVEIGRAG